ncbi:hypothetical protein [Portibacter marinus]|uniref:hypothetical protein n=1 Tax=Portibacter marinus TaxID=2898660 RepID=UPI001F48308C|nr:hypothetical protein [Portibacter marinus]
MDTKLQQDNAELKRMVKDVMENIVSVREDVHSLRSDILRQEKALATVEIDVDRIKNRLDILD